MNEEQVFLFLFFERKNIMKKMIIEVIDPINIALLMLIGIGVLVNVKQIFSLLIVLTLFVIASVTTYVYCKKH